MNLNTRRAAGIEQLLRKPIFVVANDRSLLHLAMQRNGLPSGVGRPT